MRAGADAGGTFTDVVGADGRIAKVLSSPDDPGRAVRVAVAAVAGSQHLSLLAHGTTIATNAVLEGTGAPVALVTTTGLRDLIEIARQDRPSLYDSAVTRPEPLVPRAGGSRWAAAWGRTETSSTRWISTPCPRCPPRSRGWPSASCTPIWSLPTSERSRRCCATRGLRVTCSHEVSPEMREYERMVTTVMNASLEPLCHAYLQDLDDLAESVLVMSSAGGLLPAAVAATLPAALLLSGPAAGVRAAAAAAVANGFPDAITFDMGGTSTDVCLVQGGEPAPAAQRSIGGYPVRFPSLDIHTIGAGGGSIAALDPGGALVVGPRSAGARPGPACYGNGGDEPTVTDADLLAGRIPVGTSFGGLALDRDAARRAMERAGLRAEGVLRVVDAGMERALRTVSVARGVDPRGLALVAFGGAGPLHACALAEALDMAAVIVPARAGVLSAVGLLTAPMQRDLVQSWPRPQDHTGLEPALSQLAARAAALVGPGAATTTAVDCRYAGQSHELTVPTVGDFHAAHRLRNGFDRADIVIEVVALRATAAIPSVLDQADLPAPDRPAVLGPGSVAEPDCTIWIPAGWSGEPGAAGSLVLRRERS